jgi:hypothetical protein
MIWAIKQPHENLNLKCIDAYAVVEWENDTKFHVFATEHKANT